MHSKPRSNSSKRRFHVDMHVIAVHPVRFMDPVRIGHKAFPLEMAFLREHDLEAVRKIIHFLHGDIRPVLESRGDFLLDVFYDFLPVVIRIAQIRAK